MRKLLPYLLAALLSLSMIGTALADPSPPTNGGNGAGQSGNCTGNPDGRPAVCPAADVLDTPAPELYGWADQAADMLLADASAPTNGGSNNGNGSSGQCTGDQASRPPSCHNDLGSGN